MARKALSGHGKPLRLGVIGAGFIAQVAHLEAFARVREVAISAIAEPHEELREEVARRHNIPRTFADYRELLDDSNIDAVVVSMPRRAQSGIVADAIRAKRAVLSEKPMALTLAEAETMLSEADAYRTLWAVGYMKRHDPGVKLFASILRDLVDGGAWGPILDVDMRDFCATYGVPIPDHARRIGARPIRYPENRRLPDFVAPECALAYEYTNNVASHDVNLLRLLFGDGLTPLSMRARSNGVQRAVLDAHQFTIALNIGPGDIGRWDQVLSITFEKGRATLVLPSPLARQESASIELMHADGRIEQIRIPNKDHVWSFEAQARSFAQSARDGNEPIASGRASVADVALIEGLWKIAEWQQ